MTHAVSYNMLTSHSDLKTRRLFQFEVIPNLVKLESNSERVPAPYISALHDRGWDGMQTLSSLWKGTRFNKQDVLEMEWETVKNSSKTKHEPGSRRWKRAWADPRAHLKLEYNRTRSSLDQTRGEREGERTLREWGTLITVRETSLCVCFLSLSNIS